MAVNLIIAPEVEQDIADAYAWYEKQRSELGEEFLSCVDALVQAIVRMPNVYAIVFNKYRRGLVRQFWEHHTELWDTGQYSLFFSEAFGSG
jgi:hypothetical protein